MPAPHKTSPSRAHYPNTCPGPSSRKYLQVHPDKQMQPQASPKHAKGQCGLISPSPRRGPVSERGPLGYTRAAGLSGKSSELPALQDLPREGQSFSTFAPRCPGPVSPTAGPRASCQGPYPFLGPGASGQRSSALKPPPHPLFPPFTFLFLPGPLAPASPLSFCERAGPEWGSPAPTI